MGKAFGFLLFLIAAAGATAVRGADDGINDGVDRTDPNFVTASLVTASPGEELFSCVGHAFIRLECPTFKLDYCFSDESENVRDRVFAFLAGRLKMGMFSVPTEKLLDDYRKDRRGVRQYRLNLAPDVKQRLWKLLDGKVAAVLVAWESLMLLYPHQLTDWAYVVIVAAYIVFYAKQGFRRGRLRN